MGHNMGMDHDFDESHGGSNGPCNGKGIMSYGSAPNVWSTCSRSDFLALYNQIMASSSKTWCLTSKLKTLTLLGLGLIKINDVSANFNNPRPSLILNN